MKTSQAYFKRFKAEFIRMATDLGLTHYRWDFFLVDLQQNAAELEFNAPSKQATIRLNAEGIGPTYNPEVLARHEAFHLLLADLTGLAKWRYSQREEIDEEAERIVYRLEKLFP